MSSTHNILRHYNSSSEFTDEDKLSIVLSVSCGICSISIILGIFVGSIISIRSRRRLHPPIPPELYLSETNLDETIKCPVWPIYHSRSRRHGRRCIKNIVQSEISPSLTRITSIVPDDHILTVVPRECCTADGTSTENLEMRYMNSPVHSDKEQYDLEDNKT